MKSLFSTLCDIADDLDHWARDLNLPAGSQRDNLEDIIRRLDAIIDRTIGVEEVAAISEEEPGT